MADSMLSDLPSASSINDTDLLYAVVDGVSKKITKQVLFNAVTQVLSTKADLVQGVLALAQMRENMKIVLNDTARFALTTSDVKNGFIIIVQQDEHGVPYSPNPKMYIVVDATKLDEEDGYQAFASDVDWSTIENKPDNIVFSGPALATENVPAIDAYLHKSDVVNNFTDGGTEVPLSAECGKLLNSTLTNSFKCGTSNALTITAGSSLEETITFDTPFPTGKTYSAVVTMLRTYGTAENLSKIQFNVAAVSNTSFKCVIYNANSIDVGSVYFRWIAIASSNN